LKSDFIGSHLNIKEYSEEKSQIPFEVLIIHKNHPVYIKGYSTSHKNCELSNANELKIPRNKMLKWKYVLNKILNNKAIPKDKSVDEDNLLNISNEILTFLLGEKKNYPLFQNEIEKIQNKICYPKLSQEQIEKIIIEILKIYSCSSTNANLSDFGLGDRMGRLSGFNIDSGTIINKSVTGLRTRKYEF